MSDPMLLKDVMAEYLTHLEALCASQRPVTAPSAPSDPSPGVGVGSTLFQRRTEPAGRVTTTSRGGGKSAA